MKSKTKKVYKDTKNHNEVFIHKYLYNPKPRIIIMVQININSKAFHEASIQTLKKDKNLSKHIRDDIIAYHQECIEKDQGKNRRIEHHLKKFF